MSQILRPIATVSERPDCQFPSVMHLVTMLHPESFDEVVLWVWTETSEFGDVLAECRRVLEGIWLEEGLDYRGYRFFESFEVVDRGLLSAKLASADKHAEVIKQPVFAL